MEKNIIVTKVGDIMIGVWDDFFISNFPLASCVVKKSRDYKFVWEFKSDMQKGAGLLFDIPAILLKKTTFSYQQRIFLTKKNSIYNRYVGLFLGDLQATLPVSDKSNFQFTKIEFNKKDLPQTVLSFLPYFTGIYKFSARELVYILDPMKLLKNSVVAQNSNNYKISFA